MLLGIRWPTPLTSNISTSIKQCSRPGGCFFSRYASHIYVPIYVLNLSAFVFCAVCIRHFAFCTNRISKISVKIRPFGIMDECKEKLYMYIYALSIWKTLEHFVVYNHGVSLDYHCNWLALRNQHCRTMIDSDLKHAADRCKCYCTTGDRYAFNRYIRSVGVTGEVVKWIRSGDKRLWIDPAIPSLTSDKSCPAPGYVASRLPVLTKIVAS